tara:strand:- start:4788 stop:6923 length:2136 start_codon:yes stop_codon:yes gene_type:complete
MRKFLIYVSLGLFSMISLFYLLSPNLSEIVDRIIFDKYLMTFSTKQKDFRYNLNLSINRKIKSYPTYKITSSKKNYIKIQKQVNSVFEDYLIGGNLFNGTDMYYPIKIENDRGDRSKSEIKLFGMNPDHFRDPNGHSFRSKHKGGEYFGKRKENFLKPVTRTYGVDFLWNIIYSKYSKGIRIDLKPIKVLFNNLDYGFYYLEPFFDKYLIELNNFRDSEIFEIYPDSIQLNHLPKEIEFSKFVNLPKEIRDDKLISMIDLKKTYDVISISLMSGNSHSIEDMNLHWYYNPIINKIQPTLREISSISITEVLGINKKDITESHLNELIELLIIDNYILNLAFQNDKELFLSEIKNSFEKLSSNFINDEILKDNELKNFLKYNPANYEFYKYYNKIRENIDLITPIIKKRTPKKIDTSLIYFDQNQIIKSDLTIKNKTVIFNEGINISLSNNSIIYFENCKVIFGGRKKKTYVGGVDKFKSGSILFNNCDVQIENTSFQNLQNPYEKKYNSYASITFYESNVKINNSKFSKNLSGDDYINFFRCKKASVDGSFFELVLNDAIDSDFSDINITNSTFSNIGNDAIDFSGSKSYILNNNFKYVSDKCISVGEFSKVKISENQFHDSEISIVMKDGSLINSNLNEFKNNKLDYVLFIKKPIYGPPLIDEIIEDGNTRILIDSKVEIKDDKIKHLEVSKLKNVEAILYGRKFGKSSK